MDLDRYKLIRKKWCNHCSWAIWADSSDGRPMTDMDDISFFDDDSIVKELNPNIILLGLNISGIIPGTFENFHSSGGGAYKIRYATKYTPLWGAYMTDTIKDYPELEAANVRVVANNNPDFVKKNIDLLEDEIQDLGSINPVLYAFGGDAFRILDEYLGEKYQVKKLIHYSHFMGKEEYRAHVIEEINS